jgi:tetratricopeptide (TPR) repeat protein
MTATSRSDEARREGNRLLAEGDATGAEQCYRRAVAEDPASAAAHIALGFVLFRRGELDEAKQALERATNLAPHDADSHFLLGSIARRRFAADEAVACFQRALQAQPDFAEAHLELGVALRSQRRLDEALGCFDAALALQPDNAAAQLNKALVLLMRGEFAEGLPLFEGRLRAEPAEHVAHWLQRLAAQPRLSKWRGEPLAGRRLLVWIEEGAGDCLMVMRYLPLLAAKGARELVVLADPALARVLQTLPGVGRVATRVEQVPLDVLDVHCPVMSLPHCFGTRADTIPRAVPYLAVPQPLPERWAQKLAAIRRPRVGLVWAGGAKYARDALRSLSLAQFAPLLAVRGPGFVSLQKDAVPSELQALNVAVFDPMGECADYLDTAAVIANLDLVISVDTSVAHLAGALGKPVWLLNRYESEWRWQLGREDSDWYPTMRIFTQPAFGDWASVVRRVAEDLTALR